MQTNQARSRPLAASSQRVETVLAAEAERLQQLISVLCDQIEHPAGKRVDGSDTAFADRMAEQDLLERCQLELREVHLAVKRVQKGWYGTCQCCGQPIRTERVAAMPATPFCLDCAAVAGAAGSSPGFLPGVDRSRADGRRGGH